MMHAEGLIVVDPTGPTEANCLCPCGQPFKVEAISELNLWYDEERRKLRAVCPRCSRIEHPDPIWAGPRDGSRDAGNRIKDLFDGKSEPAD